MSILQYARDVLETLEGFENNGEDVRLIIIIAAYGNGHVVRADIASDDVTFDDIARGLFALKFSEHRLIEMWDDFTSDVEIREG